MTKRTRRERAENRAGRERSIGHDPEKTLARGMSTEAVGVDEAETLASTGNQANSFQEIASGTATGIGVDREDIEGAAELTAEEDREEVAEGEPSRQDVERAGYFGPEASALRLAPGEEDDEEANASDLPSPEDGRRED